MSAAFDYEDMHHLVDRLTPTQVRRLRLLVTQDEELSQVARSLPAADMDEAEVPAPPGLLALIGSVNGPEDLADTPEDREPTSFAGTAKSLFRKHKTKIAVAVIGAVGLAAVVVRLAEGQDAAEFEDTEPSPGPEDVDRGKRKSPAGHEVVASLVKLVADQQASAERREAYKEETGEDLPPGTTYRSKHRRGDFGEDETPGEAAA
ncbi:hypothetical protein [Streptomyces sp. IBSBF 2435]|uniref:hypothetical protein n=1 Tax=Streptomyces sp. IBSBF 2435 TaxID=2903531 RepID=UPI002FDC23C2